MGIYLTDHTNMLSVSSHTCALLGSEKEMKQWAPYCCGKQGLLLSVYQTEVTTIWVKKDLHIALGKFKET